MKRVGIFTLFDDMNYGNRLQNYASQEVLKNLGWDVETILDTSKWMSFKVSTWRKIWLLVNGNRKKKVEWNKATRLENFDRFNKKYLNCWKHKLTDGSIDKVVDKRYDNVFVGSDQVWNPEFNTFSPRFFLDFVQERKRCTLSPSFGVEQIACSEYPVFREGLKGFKRISVREDKGVEIVKKITGKKAERLVDPTLVITGKEWRKMANHQYTPKNKYILLYFLGEIYKEIELTIRQINSGNQYKIVILGNNFEEEFSKIGPDHFIDFIDCAAIVLTDSYHASVFSFLLNTPFIAFERKDAYGSMNSRLESLLRIFKLENRRYLGLEKINEQMYSVDYKEAYEILNQERIKFKKFILESVKE